MTVVQRRLVVSQIMTSAVPLNFSDNTSSISCPLNFCKLFKKKSNLHYTRLIPFRVSRVSGAHLREVVNVNLFYYI